MPFVKVADLAYGRLQSPSLDQAEEFLTHFGMVRSERTPSALYMRGTDPAHHLHVTHLGPSKLERARHRFSCLWQRGVRGGPSAYWIRRTS